MPSYERSVMYKVGARFFYGEPIEPDGREPVMFSFRIDGGNEIEREATDEDKNKYPSEYADFLERPKSELQAAQASVKDAEEAVKKAATAQAEEKKRLADIEKARADKEKADKEPKKAEPEPEPKNAVSKK
jgi:hypothetical protein